MKGNVFTLALLFICSWTFAQSPAKFRYQAVARDQSGAIITHELLVRITLLEDTPAGIVRYKESHQVTPNAQGVFELTVGSGTIQSGDIHLANWSGHQYWLKVEMKSPQDADFTEMGTTQLLSVPYALYAASAGDPLTPGQGIQLSNGMIINTGDLSDQNELQTLSVNGNQLAISKGNAVTLPTGTTYTAGSGIGINGNVISAIDPSSTNEIQVLSLTGQQLSLSNGGGSVQLPVGSSSWATNGTVTSNNPTTNSVAIGTTNSSNAKLNVSSTGADRAGNFYSPGSGEAVAAYNNSNGTGVSGSSLSGQGGRFTSVNGTAAYVNSTNGPGLIVEHGYVGIGVSNPEKPLDVKGFVQIDGSAEIKGQPQEHGLRVYSSTPSKYALFADGYNGSGGALLRSYAGRPLALSSGSWGMSNGFEIAQYNDVWETYIDQNHDLNFAYWHSLKAWIYDTDGSFHNSSDSRLKKDIKPFRSVLNGLTKLQAYTYHMKDAADDSPISVGFLAQEVEAQFPELVTEKDGFKSLCYDHFAVLSVEAIKELNAEVESQKILIASQKQRLDSQEAQINALQNEFDQLKNLISQLSKQ